MNDFCIIKAMESSKQNCDTQLFMSNQFKLDNLATQTAFFPFFLRNLSAWACKVMYANITLLFGLLVHVTVVLVFDKYISVLSKQNYVSGFLNYLFV